MDGFERHVKVRLLDAEKWIGAGVPKMQCSARKIGETVVIAGRCVGIVVPKKWTGPSGSRENDGFKKNVHG